MQTGFWKELFALQDDDPEAGWGFLENEFGLFGLSPYDFLHGSCDIFAEMLHEKYGYDIEYAECLGLVHAYCVCEYNNQTYYIDVRGICTETFGFMEEFKEFIFPGKFSVQRLSSIPDRYIHNEDMARERSVAKAIIERYGYYDVSKII